MVNFNLEESNQFELTDEQTSIKNILRYLIKIYFDKSKENTKNDLTNIYEKMYCKREINFFFNTNGSLSENIKLFLDKLSYIISFVALCVSPGEFLKSEIKKEIFDNFEVINYELEKKQKELNNQFRKFLSNDNNNGQKDNYNEDFIYYEGEIYPKDKKDLFDKYKNEIMMTTDNAPMTSNNNLIKNEKIN